MSYGGKYSKSSSKDELFFLKNVPLRLENNGGGNWEVNDAKWGGKKRGVVCCPLWSRGRKLLKELNFKNGVKMIVSIDIRNFM